MCSLIHLQKESEPIHQEFLNYLHIAFTMVAIGEEITLFHAPSEYSRFALPLQRAINILQTREDPRCIYIDKVGSTKDILFQTVQVLESCSEGGRTGTSQRKLGGGKKLIVGSAYYALRTVPGSACAGGAHH